MLQDSEYFRLHQEIATSTFRTKSSDLYLSHPFLTFLNSLPLDYNYVLYRQIFQQFGTHYFSSGTVGGQYNLLFQYDRQELKTRGIWHSGMVEMLYITKCFILQLHSYYLSFSGFTKEQTNNCIQKDFSVYLFIYYTRSHSNRCGTNTQTTSYEGNVLITCIRLNPILWMPSLLGFLCHLPFY